jgi:hypothetical protein
MVPLGYAGGKTILDHYLREVRPLSIRPEGFSAVHAHQRPLRTRQPDCHQHKPFSA